MNIAGIFIRRPVMTTLVMAAILIFGIMGYRQLPVNDLPNVDFPTLLATAKPSWGQSRDHGLGRSHPSGAAVFHHRRH